MATEITLLLGPNDMPRLTKISGNVDVDSLTPFIYIAQSTDIKRVLGAELYNKILTDFDNDDLSGEYLTIYDNFIVDMLVYYSSANFIKFAPYQISNGGIYRHVPENSDAVDVEEVNQLINRYNQLGAAIEQMFYEYMKDITLPEYSKTCGDEALRFKFPWQL